ncbi:MAG: YitT family protein [Clostridia bacterium]|nr:YitT family protein [Clostridia bacterium]
MQKLRYYICSYGVIVLMAVLLAFNYYMFVIENHFAPAGLNGVITMIQYKTGFSIGYLAMLINLPLCVFVFFRVSREYALKSMVFTVVYSMVYLGLQQSGWSVLQYDAGGQDTILPTIISGVISGFVCGICFRYNSASGGMEIISKCIHTFNPNTNFFVVAFVLNGFVAIASLFVYAENGVVNYKPVALCLTYCFVSNFIGDQIIKGGKSAYKFTVITTHPVEIAEEITHTLRHGATKIAARGAYTDSDRTVLLCVVNKHQISDFKKIIDKYDETFSFCEMINETYGNFKHIRTPK